MDTDLDHRNLVNPLYGEKDGHGRQIDLGIGIRYRFDPVSNLRLSLWGGFAWLLEISLNITQLLAIASYRESVHAFAMKAVATP